MDHPNGNIFQTSGFCSFITEVPFYEPVVFAAETQSGSIAGILVGVLQKEKGFIKSLFSSRLIVWGGPLTCISDASITDLMIKSLIKAYSRKSIYIEFRNMFQMDSMAGYFTDSRFTYSEHLNFIVNTENKDQALKAISSGKSRQIKKSLKNGAIIISEISIEQVRQFYEILRNLYETKVKKPLPGWAFFEKFYYHPEIGRYLLIEYKGFIIGGIMCPVFADQTIYEWYIAGEDGKHDGVYPSILATWASIDYAINNNLKQFDFLGAGKPDEGYGVRDFKSTFGGELVSYGRFNRINNRLLYFIGKTGLNLLNQLKK
jgi:lipid II:glycine glycyltransferase (peptidoglycan interpeptide bridge formation enzyme)